MPRLPLSAPLARRSGAAAAVTAVGIALAAAALPAAATSVDQINLVTDDQAAHPALIEDPNLINAWGISRSATSPFWVSNNGTGTSTLYRVNPLSDAVSKQALTVSIPDAGTITGQVFNTAAGTGAFNGDNFLFVSEDGGLYGWRNALGTTAERILQAPSPSNAYKGVALGGTGGGSYLYAANFRTGAIDVFKGKPGFADLGGNFTDPNLPAGYAPFNVQNLGGTLYVAYALTDPNSPDEVAGPGLGIVDAFDLQGNLVARIAGGGTLDAPWGLAIAPSSFGSLANALLVGNFGDGSVSAFDIATHDFLGQLLDDQGQVLAIDGLWALMPGSGAGNGGSANEIYFSAGPDDETHGLFGVLRVIPEPGVLALAMLAMLLVGAFSGAPRARG